jgi:DnaJ-class molecular chaperone
LNEDYYAILGVKRNATIDDIKYAYRQLAKTHHPDRGGSPEYFSKVTTAYNVLSNPQNRQNYNQYNAQNFRKPSTLSLILTVTLQDLYSSDEKILNVNTTVGQINLSITIPPDIEFGDRMKYPSVGPRGEDLIVVFHIVEDPIYTRVGLDLICTIDVSVLELLHGTTKTVSTPDGRKFDLKIPECTSTTKTFKLPNLGFKKNTKTGDFLIKIEPTFPKTISSKLKDAIASELTTPTTEDYDGIKLRD